jgi:hypothetical protein
MTSDDLRRRNIEIGRAEKDHDVAALGRILHEELAFRRANGKVVRKQEYLDALRERPRRGPRQEISGGRETIQGVVGRRMSRAVNCMSTGWIDTTWTTATFLRDDDSRRTGRRQAPDRGRC